MSTSLGFFVLLPNTVETIPLIFGTIMVLTGVGLTLREFYLRHHDKKSLTPQLSAPSTQTVAGFPALAALDREIAENFNDILGRLMMKDENVLKTEIRAVRDLMQKWQGAIDARRNREIDDVIRDHVDYFNRVIDGFSCPVAKLKWDNLSPEQLHAFADAVPDAELQSDIRRAIATLKTLLTQREEFQSVHDLFENIITNVIPKRETAILAARQTALTDKAREETKANLKSEAKRRIGENEVRIDANALVLQFSRALLNRFGEIFDVPVIVTAALATEYPESPTPEFATLRSTPQLTHSALPRSELSEESAADRQRRAQRASARIPS